MTDTPEGRTERERIKEVEDRIAAADMAWSYWAANPDGYHEARVRLCLEQALEVVSLEAPAPPEPTPLERLSAALDGYDEVQDNSIREVSYDVAALAAAARGLVEAPTPPAPEEPHDFIGVAAHPDDDECTHRSDGTDNTYCGRTEDDPLHDVHAPPAPEPPPEPARCQRCDGQGMLWSKDTSKPARCPRCHDNPGIEPPPAPSGPLGQQDPDLVAVMETLRTWVGSVTSDSGLASRNLRDAIGAALLAVPTEAPEVKP